MPTLSNPELAEALEGANSLILRWGHNQMRQLKAEEVERIVAALKASASSERAAWIPVAERLPEVGVDVLAFNPHNKAIWIEHRERDDEGLDEAVSHWMPLPKAPSGERPRGDK